MSDLEKRIAELRANDGLEGVPSKKRKVYRESISTNEDDIRWKRLRGTLRAVGGLGGVIIPGLNGVTDAAVGLGDTVRGDGGLIQTGGALKKTYDAIKGVGGALTVTGGANQLWDVLKQSQDHGKGSIWDDLHGKVGPETYRGNIEEWVDNPDYEQELRDLAMKELEAEKIKSGRIGDATAEEKKKRDQAISNAAASVVVRNNLPSKMAGGSVQARLAQLDTIMKGRMKR
jgi:hypothetical protein